MSLGTPWLSAYVNRECLKKEVPDFILTAKWEPKSPNVNFQSNFYTRNKKKKNFVVPYFVLIYINTSCPFLMYWPPPRRRWMNSYHSWKLTFFWFAGQLSLKTLDFCQWRPTFNRRSKRLSILTTWCFKDPHMYLLNFYGWCL